MRAADLRSPRRRLRVVQVAIVAGFLALTARVAYLSLDDRSEARGDRQLLSAISLAPERGRIYDREGELLALSVPAPSLYAVPEAIGDPAAVARALAPVLGSSASALRRRIEDRHSFVFVRRWLDTETARRVESLDLAGVGLVEEARRAYPLGALGGPVLGFTNIDGEGVRGVEQLETTWLEGRRVRVGVERDARGRLLIGPGLDPVESSGGDIAVTLDAAMQAHAEVALAEAVRRYRARGGFVVTLDPATGEILALAEWPRFDPNRFREVPYPDTRSRVFLDAFEPGSTLKAFVAAAALDAGVIGPGEALDLDGGVRVPGKWIRDRIARPSLDLAGILRVSSNAGAVRVAQRLGAEQTHDALLRFGFGRSTGSGFPEESAGLLRSWEQWRPIDHATVAFGQGVSVTPVQLAAATASLAADGRWRSPRLIRARRRPEGEWIPVPPAPSREAVSAQSAAAIREMLVGVTERGGTGSRAALRGVAVGGKTGTAQKFDRSTGRYSDDAMVAWFAGFAPAATPRLAIVVGLDEARGEAHSGGEVAAPLFAEVAAAHLTHLGIPTRPRRGWDDERPATPAAPATPTTPTTPTTRMATAPKAASAAAHRASSAAAQRDDTRARPGSSATVPQPPPAASRPPARPRASARSWIRVGERVFLPDLRGLSREEVRRFAEETEVRVELSGEGPVVAQDPPPGTILAAGGAPVRLRCDRRGRPQ